MCRREFQIYRAASVALLQQHITEGTTISLLREPPTKKLKVSPHVRERTQKKATMVMLFLKYMQIRDSDRSHFEVGGKHASDMAAKVGDLLGTNRNAVYKAYKEWKNGERVEGDDDVPPRPGAY